MILVPMSIDTGLVDTEHVYVSLNSDGAGG